MSRVLRVYNEQDEVIAQVDTDGVVHVVRNGAAPIRFRLTVQRGDAIDDADLPVCSNVWCSLCHPTVSLRGETSAPAVPNREPVPLPSAFNYLLGEPHA